MKTARNTFIWLTVVLAGLLPTWGAAQIENEGVGNVTTTSFALCWEVTEVSDSAVRVYTAGDGSVEVTDQVRVEIQDLQSRRREVGTSAVTREEARRLKEMMKQRQVALVRVSGLMPNTDYWVEAVALQEGSEVDSSALIPVTTASRAEMIVEARQLIVDFSTLEARAGDISGVILRISNTTSPYPLFAVVNDIMSNSHVFVDLTHFLDASGETNLIPAPGSSLDLSISYLGSLQQSRTYTDNEIEYDGGAEVAAISETALLLESPILDATPDQPTAVLGIPFFVNMTAKDDDGDILSGYNASVDLTSAALDGGGHPTSRFVAGQLTNEPVTLNAVGTQTVVVTDPPSGANTSFSINVIAYNYDNFRSYYFGDLVSPAGEPDANGDDDAYNNFHEFVHGLNPLIGDGIIKIGGDGIVVRGGATYTLQVTAEGNDFSVTYLRPKNYQALGLSFVPQVSNGLAGWFSSPAAGSVVGEDNGMEVVHVPLPEFTPEPKEARFFRLKIDGP